MKTHTLEIPYRRPLMVSLGVLLVIGGGIFAGHFAPSARAAVSIDPTVEALQPRLRCSECGVIVSTRVVDEIVGAPVRLASGDRQEAAVASSRRYEMTVRMSNGVSRVFSDANPVDWRAGDRVTLIAGVAPEGN